MSAEPPASALAVHLRPTAERDLPAVAELSAQAFGQQRSPELDRWRRRRLAHPLATDPGGAFLAECDGAVIGAVQAIRRERLWCLSQLVVRPSVQSAGAGRRLLERALSYGADAGAGLIPSSNDPRALRLYALAGFELRPSLETVGELDRSSLPHADPRIREAGTADLEALAEISRAIRGAAHTSELELALELGAQLIRLADRGFAVATPEHGVWLLVARDEEAASSLLWSALALSGGTGHPLVRWITGAQRWAVEVLLRARLQLVARGALCVRGEPGPLHPFLPSGPFA